TGCRVESPIHVPEESAIAISGIRTATGITVETLEPGGRVETSIRVAKKCAGPNRRVVAAAGEMKERRIAFSSISVGVGSIRRGTDRSSRRRKREQDERATRN